MHPITDRSGAGPALRRTACGALRTFPSPPYTFMTQWQYHQVLIGLDRALFVFHEAKDDLSPPDQQFAAEIVELRAKVLRALSGEPLPTQLPRAGGGPLAPPPDRLSPPAAN